MKRLIIIHYGEVGLKGSNKQYFVKKLNKAIKTKLEKKFRDVFRVTYTLGRLLVSLPEKFKEEDYVEVLRKIFGIKNFKFVYVGSSDLEKLKEQIQKELPDVSDFETFRVKVKRSMKMDENSSEMARDLGAHLLVNDIGLNVKLKNPDFTVDIEFFNELGYFSFKTYKGQAGMPVNSQSKLVSLMSSGIDSPVASFQMMRRGARVIFVHFHGYPYTDKSEMDQCRELVEILSEYQFDTKLYLVPFGKIQKEIALNRDVPAKVRTVLYRRLMLRIAEKIAKRNKAKGLITGDNYGQVASQTPENMYAIHDATTIPLYQPLIAYDKEDIIKVSEEIGCFEISKLPCKDSCSMFMPKVPELKANIYDLREYEDLLPLDEWFAEAIAGAETVIF